MLLKILYLCTSLIYAANAVRYDCYTATEACEELLEKYNKSGNLEICTVDIKPCDPEEGIRLDGSCNNLEHPSIGTFYTPLYRLLKPEFLNDSAYEELLSPRAVRSKLLPEGSSSSSLVTQLLTHFMVGNTMDLMSVHDTMNYLTNTINCCTPEGSKNYLCATIKVDEDDHVHKFTGCRCMNLTRPLGFQDFGCAPKNTDHARVMNATSIIDLSQVYNYKNGLMQKARTFTGGRLKVEEEDGKIWGPSAETPEDCIANDKNTETRCNAYTSNGILGGNLFIIWLWRMHNVIASELEEINPCWDDEKLFFTARQILIAMWMQIVFYEALPIMMGRENMISAGIISSDPGFRDIYNPAITPQTSAEFLYLSRWCHLAQEGMVKMYDKDGFYVNQIPIVNLTLRFGYLARDDRLSHITQGAIRQPSGDFNFIVDPLMAEVGLGSLQRATDLFANDLAKGRLNGFPSYVKYRNFCAKRQHTSFADLASVLDPGRLRMIKNVYGNDCKKVEFMAGVWSEKLIPNGLMPYTMYCIYVDQFYRAVVSNRHWYERPNRPHAMNDAQLQEIRKMSVAAMLCKVGDSITKIQPNAFLLPLPGNEMVDCSLIPQVNLSAWKDPDCCK